MTPEERLKAAEDNAQANFVFLTNRITALESVLGRLSADIAFQDGTLTSHSQRITRLEGRVI